MENSKRYPNNWCVLKSKSTFWFPLRNTYARKCSKKKTFNMARPLENIQSNIIFDSNVIWRDIRSPSTQIKLRVECELLGSVVFLKPIASIFLNVAKSKNNWIRLKHNGTNSFRNRGMFGIEGVRYSSITLWSFIRWVIFRVKQRDKPDSRIFLLHGVFIQSSASINSFFSWCIRTRHFANCGCCHCFVSISGIDVHLELDWIQEHTITVDTFQFVILFSF